MPISELIALGAGLGAGVAIGLFSASAVAIIAPILIIALKLSSYEAIGISLASDVPAAIISALIYRGHGRIKIKESLLMLAFAIGGAVVGSFLSIYIPDHGLSAIVGFGVLLTGSLFIYRSFSESDQDFFQKISRRVLKSTARERIFHGSFGFFIGGVGGLFGAGGGLIILTVLTLVLNYKMHEAIGTSVFLMAFIALSGAAAHYYYQPFSLTVTASAAGGAVAGAVAASYIANKMSEKILRRIVGISFVSLGVSLMIRTLLQL